MGTWTGWREQLLAAAGVTKSADNLTFLSDWHKYANTDCRDNPVDISLNISGASPCKLTSNPQHRARNYASPDQAAGQFAAQLNSGTYPHLLAALQSGSPYDPTGSDQVGHDLGVWGSAKFGAHYAAEVNAKIGSGSITAARAHHGWSDLQHSINHNMPTSLRNAERNTRVALRSLSKGRKVRL